MRKAIARKMTQVKQTVPHAYTVVEVDMTSVVAGARPTTWPSRRARAHRSVTWLLS